MLCVKHERQARREGWLWQYPGDYMDDYTGEGEDALDEICDWAIAFDMDTVLDTVAEYFPDLLVKFEESREFTIRRRHRQVGFGGYIPDENCDYCLKPFNERPRRGLCKNCYEKERDADHLWRYPTNRYRNNVKGHVWWMLRYQFERFVSIAEAYGVYITVRGS